VRTGLCSTHTAKRLRLRFPVGSRWGCQWARGAAVRQHRTRHMSLEKTTSLTSQPRISSCQDAKGMRLHAPMDDGRWTRQHAWGLGPAGTYSDPCPVCAFSCSCAPHLEFLDVEQALRRPGAARGRQVRRRHGAQRPAQGEGEARGARGAQRLERQPAAHGVAQERPGRAVRQQRRRHGQQRRRHGLRSRACARARSHTGGKRRGPVH
jgi:hypothetical protein